jgi:acetylornithine deacetylase/succinyl-diaminopimelate desuccinylase-like protein
MVDERTPTITVGLHGLIQFTLTVRTAQRDLHGGVFGGSALNALHALHAILAGVLPGCDGRLREELREGIVPPSEAEVASWAELPSGDGIFTSGGARPLYPGACAEYYVRNGADASLDLHAIHAGEPRIVSLPGKRRAREVSALSRQLRPRQRSTK